jgi:hypothetical protein
MKKIAVLIGFFSALLLGVELCWYLECGGNFIVYLQNQSKDEKFINLKLEIDDKVIFEGDIAYGDIVPQQVCLFKGMGLCNLTVWKNGEIVATQKSFNFMLVKWVVIDYFSDDTLINSHYIPPLFQ